MLKGAHQREGAGPAGRIPRKPFPNGNPRAEGPDAPKGRDQCRTVACWEVGREEFLTQEVRACGGGWSAGCMH